MNNVSLLFYYYIAYFQLGHKLQMETVNHQHQQAQLVINFEICKN